MSPSPSAPIVIEVYWPTKPGSRIVGAPEPQGGPGGPGGQWTTPRPPDPPTTSKLISPRPSAPTTTEAYSPAGPIGWPDEHAVSAQCHRPLIEAISPKPSVPTVIDVGRWGL